MYDIIIIGSGCAGMTAAIYACRASMKVLLLESELVGGQIAYSHRVENFPSVEAIDGATFSERLLEQATSFGAEFKFEAVSTLRESENGWTVTTDSGEYEGKAIIIAVGMKRRLLGVDGEEELTGAGVSYCAVCDGSFFADQDVAIVGGGQTALQDALYLADICKSVTLIHRREGFRADETTVRAVKNNPKVKMVLNARVAKIVGESSIEHLEIEDIPSGNVTKMPVDGLFIAIGNLPATTPFKDIIELDGEGFVLASEDCHTSKKGIFVAGDCRQKTVRQLTTAASDGSVAALAASEYVRGL